MSAVQPSLLAFYCPHCGSELYLALEDCLCFRCLIEVEREAEREYEPKEAA